MELGDIVVSALQIGLPAANPGMLELSEIWIWNTAEMVLLTDLWLLDPDRPLRIPFTVGLPAGGGRFTLQVVCLMLNPITNAGCLDGMGQPVPMTTFASPALFFEY